MNHEYWVEHPDVWRRLNEEGRFRNQHNIYLESREFEGPNENIYRMTRSDLQDGIPASVLFRECGLVRSNNAAKRLIEQGGAYINTIRVKEGETINIRNVIAGEIVLRAGKKHHRRILVS